MKKYILVSFEVKRHRFPAQKINNPLKLSEFHLVREIARQHKKITIEYMECSTEQYKQIFG